MGVIGSLDVGMLIPSNYSGLMSCSCPGSGTIGYTGVNGSALSPGGSYRGAKFTFNRTPRIILVTPDEGGIRIIIPNHLMLYHYRTNMYGNSDKVISTPQLNKKYTDIQYDDTKEYFMMSNNYKTFEFVVGTYKDFFVDAWG